MAAIYALLMFACVHPIRDRSVARVEGAKALLAYRQPHYETNGEQKDSAEESGTAESPNVMAELGGCMT
jgi:hypothetical protein